MNSLFKVEIPKRRLSCAQDGKKFIPGTEIYSLLYEDEFEKLHRKDFCSVCWGHQLNQIENIKKRVSWKFQLEEKNTPIATNRTAQALRLLKELRNSSDQEKLFILCLYLVRIKLLALRKEIQNDEGHFYLYEILGEEDYLTIRVMHLKDEQIGIIQQSIASDLNR